ncbi:MAG: 6-bladed beta-propeller [Bacteroidales bacterium]|nr:6-bladed beta-propeller [Bacteroidales bacterium]
MKNKIIILICVLFLICSCSSVNTTINIQKLQFDTSKSKIIDVNEAIENYDEYFFIEDLVDTIKLIQLETTEESLVGDIYEIKMSDNYIYIFDDFNRGSVIIFDKNGKFVKRISTGNGPGEIDFVVRIMYDEINKFLFVYQYGKISKYSETGVFIKDYQIDYYVTDFIAYKNGYICFQDEGQSFIRKYTINFTDSSFNILRTKYLEDENNIRTCFPNSISYDDNNCINFVRMSDNSVYNINDTTISKKYILNFDKHEREIIKDKYISDIEFYQTGEIDKYIFQAELLEVSNYLYFTLNDYRGNHLMIYYNKNTKKIKCGNLKNIDKGLLNDVVLISHEIGVYNDYYVSVFDSDINPFNYNIDYNEKNSHPKIANYVDMLKNFKDDDNPIIVMYKLKDIE